MIYRFDDLSRRPRALATNLIYGRLAAQDHGQPARNRLVITSGLG